MRGYLCAIYKIEWTIRNILKLYKPFKREWGKKWFIQKIYKNQSKKLLQCNLIWIVIKFKNFKIFNVFIIIFMLKAKKSDI